MAVRVNELAEALECSELGAREVLKHGQALAQHFFTVYGVFSLDCLVEIQRKTREEAYLTRPPYVEHGGKPVSDWHAEIDKIRKSLSRPTRNMLSAYELAASEGEVFHKAVIAAKIEIDDRFKRSLTAVLSHLHQGRKIREPEKVYEGRVAFNAIVRGGNLSNLNIRQRQL